MNKKNSWNPGPQAQKQMEGSYAKWDRFLAQKQKMWSNKIAKGSKSFETQMGFKLKNNGEKKVKYNACLVVKGFEQK